VLLKPPFQSGRELPMSTEVVVVTKPPMSNTTKILIGVGIVALLGAGYYFMKKRK
jgi:LPXTG-motif cell wall-anchored protein